VPGVDYRKMEAPFIWQTMNWECSLLIVNHPYPIMVLIIAVQCVGYLQYLLNAHHVSILLVKNLGSSHNIVSEFSKVILPLKYSISEIEEIVVVVVHQ